MTGMGSLIAARFHDALSYVQGNLGLKPWSSRYGWWRGAHSWKKQYETYRNLLRLELIEREAGRDLLRCAMSELETVADVLDRTPTGFPTENIWSLAGKIRRHLA